MKRGWIGALLLLLLLAAGTLSTRCMVHWYSPMKAQMEVAARSALESDWVQADKVIQQVSSRWEEQWHTSAVFADHGPMEEIDGLFAQLEIYEEKQEALGFAAVCAELSQKLAAMGEAHVPNWWNLL